MWFYMWFYISSFCFTHVIGCTKSVTSGPSKRPYHTDTSHSQTVIINLYICDDISGYDVYLVKDACRPVAAASDELALTDMEAKG